MRRKWVFLCGLLTIVGCVSSTPQDDLKTLYDRKVDFILQDGLAKVSFIPSWYVTKKSCSVDITLIDNIYT